MIKVCNCVGCGAYDKSQINRCLTKGELCVSGKCDFLLSPLRLL